jgi:hypothetical protein
MWRQRVGHTLSGHAGVTGPYLSRPIVVIPTSRGRNSNIPRLMQEPRASARRGIQ